jgi:hypothetical protein
MPSVIPYLPRGVFDESTARLMGQAFDAACKELSADQRTDDVRAAVAKRIIAAANKGVRNIARLRNAGLRGIDRTGSSAASAYDK